MNKKWAAVFLAVLNIIALSACGNFNQAEEPPVLSVPTPILPQIDGIGFADGLVPITIIRSQTVIDENNLFFPSVVSDGAKPLNDAIYTAIVTGMKYVDSPVHTYYTIEYNRNNMLSVLVSYNLISSDETVLLLPLNYYVDSALPINITDCINSDDNSWRPALAESIKMRAQENRITLLSDVPLISDDTLFYFDDESLTIVYRPYEISTFSPATPEFRFEMKEFSDYVVQGSPLFKEEIFE